MELKAKFLKWSAGLPVAMLNKDTADKLGIHPTERILIKALSGEPKEMFAITDVVKRLVKKNELGVSFEIKKNMGLVSNQRVEVSLAPAPKSLGLIKKKLNGKALSENEINEIIKDITNNSLSEAEIALFVSAMYRGGTSMKETIFLINSILKTGNKLNLKSKLVADKHSIGGVAGRVTPIVVSICAAAGLIMPKTSSRAITSPAGTADALETLCEVDFTMEELRRIIRKTGACMVWGGGLGMVPADSKIIQVEKHLEIDPEAQLLASIMSKKLAVGSNYLVIHLPYGKTAKVNKSKALRLKSKFEYLAKHFKIKIKVVLTKNFGPLGKGVGPILEMIDVINILKGDYRNSLLEKRALELAGALLELTRKAKKNKGESLAKEILDSGKALEKFKQIIKAQKGSLKDLQPGKFKKDFFSSKSGKIMEIDNKKISGIARVAGCPVDKGAGLFLYKSPGERVKRKEKIFTLYAESKSRLKEAISFYKKNNPITLK